MANSLPESRKGNSAGAGKGEDGGGTQSVYSTDYGDNRTSEPLPRFPRFPGVPRNIPAVAIAGGFSNGGTGRLSGMGQRSDRLLKGESTSGERASRAAVRNHSGNHQHGSGRGKEFTGRG